MRELAVAGVVPATGGQPSAWATYISTEDIDATAKQVTAAGGVTIRPPTEVGGRGVMALFADPEGAVFGAWQRGTFSGAQVASEANAVCWSDIGTRDVAAAASFYGKVFGWVERDGSIPTGYDYREWWVNGRVVAGATLMGPEFPPEVPAHWRTTIEVADCAQVAGRCAELGGQVVAGPMDVRVGQYAQLVDPQGAALGVIELLPELRVTV